jgi:hypothetical protein
MIEGSMEVGGAVVFWTAAEFTDRTRLQQAFDGLGLGPYVPDPRPDSAVLREALEEVCGGPRVLVRPLADRDGFAVVKEDRGSTANSYTTLLVARVSGTPPRLQFEPHSLLTADVQRAFDQHRGRIPAAQLSACLVKVVESLGGTRLRPTGAVYWVPGHRVAEWGEVAAAVEGASEGKPSAVYLLLTCVTRRGQPWWPALVLAGAGVAALTQQPLVLAALAAAHTAFDLIGP